MAWNVVSVEDPTEEKKSPWAVKSVEGYDPDYEAPPPLPSRNVEPVSLPAPPLGGISHPAAPATKFQPDFLDQPFQKKPLKDLKSFLGPKSVADEEAEFQDWYAQKSQSSGLNPDPDHPLHYYDFRGAFRAGAEPDPMTGHWDSRFKKPDHPNRFVGGVDTITGRQMMQPQFPMPPPPPPIPQAPMGGIAHQQGQEMVDPTLDPVSEQFWHQPGTGIETPEQAALIEKTSPLEWVAGGVPGANIGAKNVMEALRHAAAGTAFIPLSEQLIEQQGPVGGTLESLLAAALPTLLTGGRAAPTTGWNVRNVEPEAPPSPKQEPLEELKNVIQPVVQEPPKPPAEIPAEIIQQKSPVVEPPRVSTIEELVSPKPAEPPPPPPIMEPPKTTLHDTSAGQQFAWTGKGFNAEMPRSSIKAEEPAEFFKPLEPAPPEQTNIFDAPKPPKGQFNPESDSLSDFVRKSGGISLDKETMLKGEVRDRFSIKEGHNLINNKTGKPVDDLLTEAKQHDFWGVDENTTAADFMEILRKDVDAKTQGTARVWSMQKQDFFPTITGGAARSRTPEGGEPKYAASINLDRINTSDDAKDFILSSANAKGGYQEARRGTQSHEATRQLADELGMSEEELLKRKPGMAFNAEEGLRARQLHADAVDRVMKAVADRNVKADEFNAIVAKYYLVAEAESGIATEAGRALGARRIIVSPGDTGAFTTDKIMDIMRKRKIDPDTVRKFLSKMDPKDTAGTAKLLRDMIIKQKFADMVHEYWINAILSAPITQIRNITGNTMTMLTKPVEQVLAAGSSALRGGKRERFAGEVQAGLFGMKQGLQEGTRKALYVWKHGFPEEASTAQPGLFHESKLEALAHRKAIPGKVGEVIRTPGKLLTMADQIMGTMINRMHIHELAYRKAMQEGLKGQKKTNRIADLIANPTDEMMKAAKVEQYYRTFQQDLGKWGKWIDRGRHLEIGGVKPLAYIVPFLRTMINITKYGLERSPYSAGYLALKQLSHEPLKGGELDDQLARFAIGAGIGAWAGWKYINGEITGAAPEDEGQRNAFYAAGKKDYAFKSGDKWVQYKYVEPFATSLGTTVDAFQLIDAAKSEDEADEAALKAIFATVNNLKSKSFATGITNFMDVIDNPSRYGGKYFKNFAGSFVPNIAGSAARAIDPTVRQQNTFAESIQAKIPGLSDDLHPKLDHFGREIKRPGGEGVSGAATRFLSPVSVATPKPEKADLEIERLGLSVQPPSRSITVAGEKIEIPGDQYEAYSKRAGQMAFKRIQSLVSASNYDKIPDEEKKDLIRKVFTESRAAVRPTLRLQAPKKKPSGGPEAPKSKFQQIEEFMGVK